MPVDRPAVRQADQLDANADKEAENSAAALERRRFGITGQTSFEPLHGLKPGLDGSITRDARARGTW